MLAKNFARAFLRIRFGEIKRQGFCVVEIGAGYLLQGEQVSQWKLAHDGVEPAFIVVIERYKLPVPNQVFLD